MHRLSFIITAVYNLKNFDFKNVFGSSFNTRAADIFNLFITSAGVEEVPLGGSVYTWCHRSASKMSKLDRFLVSENLLRTCPYISAVTLDRYLSDHRPILLRESKFNYGPTPFRFFHHWLEVEGLNNLVIDMWNLAPGDVNNGMRNLIFKLKFLKSKIREWCFGYRLKVKGESDRLKAELRKLDDCIDNGKGSEEIVLQRATVVNSLQDIQNRHAMDVAQKAKIK
ncbi:RNA-directed DNA polymerase, eukaryota [Tanacetum coccineum]